MKKRRIALFHPWIKSKGGAEKVVLELSKLKGYDVDIYTWAYDKKNTFKEFENLKVNVIAPKFMQRFSRKFIFRGFFLLISFFSKIPLKKYDKFLISTSGVGEFITFRNYKKNQTYAYVHTPLREANRKIIRWNLENRYKGLKKYFYLLSVGIYKTFEKKAWRRIDHVIFNSELTKSRAEEHNLLKGKEICVINPPVNLSKRAKVSKGDYFLYVSRINPPKRQKELIEAFSNFSKDYPNLKLILVGTPENKEYYERIKEISKEKNIELKKNLSDEEINTLYNNCLAGIFLGYQEDFGIVPLEVIGRGKPMLAVDEGGYVEVIKDNPLFHKIRERHGRKEIVEEIEGELRNFMKKKKKKKGKKLKLKNFKKEIKKILKDEK